MRSMRNIFLILAGVLTMTACGGYVPKNSNPLGITQTVSRGGQVYEILQPGDCAGPTDRQINTIKRLERLSANVPGARDRITRRSHRAEIKDGDCMTLFVSQGGAQLNYGDGKRLRLPRLKRRHGHYGGHGELPLAYKVWVPGHGHYLIDPHTGRVIDDYRR